MYINKGILIQAIPLKNKLKLKQLKRFGRNLLTLLYKALEHPEARRKNGSRVTSVFKGHLVLF